MKEREEIFRTLAEQSPNMIFINCMGRVVYANERCEAVMGYSRAEFYSEDFDFLTLIAPESRELVSDNFRRHLAGEDLAPYEYALITKDDTRIDVIITTKVMNYDGERALLGIITDISDRKRAEAEVRRRLEFEKTVAAISSHFVGFADTDQAIDRSLGEMGRVCGADRVYTFHFSSDLSVMENTHEWCCEGVEPQIENLQNLQTESFPWWMANLKNNEIINIEDVSRLPPEARSEREILEDQGIKSLIVLPLFVKGKLSGFVGFDKVVTTGKWHEEDVSLLRLFSEILSSTFERQWADRALRENEEKYRQLVEYAPTGIYEVDLSSGKFLSVNDVMCEYLGYTREELLEMNADSLLADEEGRRQAAERMAKLAAGENVSETAEYRIRTKDGRHIWSLVNARLHRKRGNSLIAQVVTQDITERKELENQIRQAQKMEAVGTLAGGIAHDFNNLLMGIQGNTSLMLIDMEEDHPHFERLKNIEQFVKSGAELTQQLLGFARGGKFQLSPIDLNDLIDRSIKLFGRTRKEIKIHTKYATDLWTVEADQGQIEQTLLNIYVNAGQAMPEGGDLYIQTENLRFKKGEPPFVKVTITDTGVGMDRATQERIFEPFFSTKKEGGIGLGLSSAYGIVKKHGGNIEVSSIEGKGTSFTIHLPASREILKG